MNSGLYLSCYDKCYEASKIFQEKNIDTLEGPSRQKWMIEYQGRNLYVIRSSLNLTMMIGIREKDFNNEGPLILSTN